MKDYSDVFAWLTSCGDTASRRRRFWHFVKKTCRQHEDPSALATRSFDGPVRDSAMIPAESLNKSSFFLGHVSVQTTERYIGCKQHFRIAVNDRPGIEAWVSSAAPGP